MQLSENTSFVNKIAIAALLGAIGMQGALAANPTTPMFKGKLLLQTVLDNGKCMTASSNKNGAAVTLQGCTGADSQLWEFKDGGVKVYGNKCLEVTGGSTTNGNNLQISDCSGNPNQKWDYDIWGNRLIWKDHNKCADLSAGSTADGTRVHLWDCVWNTNQVWNTGYMANALPEQSQDEQYGTNKCGTGSTQDSNCQTAWINSADDFCLWAPPTPNGSIGPTEEYEVAWCTKSGRGTRVMPEGTLKGVHFVETPDYVQITGVGDFTKINIKKGDSGGELDNRGPTGKGNPIGGLLFGNTFGNAMQYHEWTNFMSDKEFCIRACKGPNATKLCNHIYDEMGCWWNMPANYDEGTFEQCKGDDAIPMGIYGTSTFHQGDAKTPDPHPAPASSECKPLPSISPSPVQAKRALDKQFKPKFPGQTPAPVPAGYKQY